MTHDLCSHDVYIYAHVIPLRRRSYTHKAIGRELRDSHQLKVGVQTAGTGKPRSPYDRPRYMDASCNSLTVAQITINQQQTVARIQDLGIQHMI